MSRADEVIERLQAEIVKRDARIAELDLQVFQLTNSVTSHHRENQRLRDELKAQQPSADEVLPARELFEEWADEHGFCLDCKFFEEGNNFESADTRMAFDIWMASASLNPCRAVAVPDGYVVVTVDGLKHVRRDLDACQRVIWLGLRGADPAYCADAQARLADIDSWLDAAPSAQQKESGDE